MTDSTPIPTEQPTDEQQLAAPVPTMTLAEVMSPAALAALEKAGISPDRFRAPAPPEVTVTAWEALAVQPSRYPKARGQTRPLVYLSHEVRSDEPAPKGYAGNLYVNVVDPQLGALVVKTGYARETGELLPVSEWVTSLMERGDVFVVADIETKQGNTVYRPINPTTWAV